MNPGKALILVFSMLVGAIVISYAHAASSPDTGRYVLSSSDGVAYRMNTSTGEISICVKGITMEEAVGCSPWAK